MFKEHQAIAIIQQVDNSPPPSPPLSNFESLPPSSPLISSNNEQRFKFIIRMRELLFASQESFSLNPDDEEPFSLDQLAEQLFQSCKILFHFPICYYFSILFPFLFQF